jgi:FlaA1/EpsC-like NDP-sugar epimerase
LLERFPGIGVIVAFSNSEQEQYEMAARYPSGEYPVSYIVGDVRDRDRIMMACRGIDVLIHTAAMKHVPVSEINPIECAKTNIIGSQNVIDAAVTNGIGRVVALSTDKAVYPINAYGASKLFLERLFVGASLQYETRFSVVRYANVFGSKGSVAPFFLKQKANGFLPITHPDMTRFSISMREGLDLILFAIEHGWGGEVILPISPSYRILDVAEAIAPGFEKRIVGIRPGEKINEMLLCSAESIRTVKRDSYYIVCPENGAWGAEDYCRKTGAQKVPDGFEYESGNNTEWLTVEQIRGLVEKELAGVANIK